MITGIKKELIKEQEKQRKPDNNLIFEAKQILQKDLFNKKNILENLHKYNSSQKTVDEESVESEHVFTLFEIKKIAVLYRLKFLDGNLYRPELPYEADLRIQYLNDKFYKAINEYKILASYDSFKSVTNSQEALLFIKTNYENYYLVHNWGKPIRANRKIWFLPLRNFESLVTTVFLVTLLITVSLPTRLITLDHSAGYWSGYRMAAFFHLLIFNFGVTAYFTFAFGKNLSSSVWDRYKDF